jgi:hypothetical protein
MSNQGFTAVLPDPDDEFQEDQTPCIVLGCDEYLIKNLVIDGDGKGGVFTALKLNPLKSIPLKPWKLLPDNRLIDIKEQNELSDSECRFVFLD